MACVTSTYPCPDGRVRSLQSLAAHVKLLLDSPEHLWRLIEAKKYSQAAWLFLLARVVYRGLSMDDVEEEEWPDIDVMARAVFDSLWFAHIDSRAGAVPSDSTSVGDCGPLPFPN
jgi:hypothetical protein